jgi:hypothetical protein
MTPPLAAHCSYLSYDSNNRKLTFTPRSTADWVSGEKTFQITAKSTNFPLNTNDQDFKVEGLAPCSATGYTANRMNILAQPLIYKYDIGADGDTIFPFTFDIFPSLCTPNYTK